MASISVFNFARPRVVAPGEYFVSTNEHYQQTDRNAHWDSPSPPPPQGEQSYYRESSASSEASMSPPSSPEISLREATGLSSKTPRPRHPKLAAPVSGKAPSTPRPSAKSPGSAKKKKTSSRRVETAPWTKPTPHKKRAKRPTPDPLGPWKCKWAGCGEVVTEGRDIWAHIRDAHNGGKTVVSERKAPALAKDAKDHAAKKKRPVMPPRFVRKEIENYDDDDDDDDMDVDEPKANQAAAETDGKRDEYELEGKSEDESDQEPEDAEPTYTVSATRTEQWFDKVRCRWAGCAAELQYMGLRRHIETKHVPLRGATCPHAGCGHWVRRADMMWRHAERCPFNKALKEESEDEDEGKEEMEMEED